MTVMVLLAVKFSWHFRLAWKACSPNLENGKNSVKETSEPDAKPSTTPNKPEQAFNKEANLKNNNDHEKKRSTSSAEELEDELKAAYKSTKKKHKSPISKLVNLEGCSKLLDQAKVMIFLKINYSSIFDRRLWTSDLQGHIAQVRSSRTKTSLKNLAPCKSSWKGWQRYNYIFWHRTTNLIVDILRSKICWRKQQSSVRCRTWTKGHFVNQSSERWSCVIFSWIHANIF